MRASARGTVDQNPGDCNVVGGKFCEQISMTRRKHPMSSNLVLPLNAASAAVVREGYPKCPRLAVDSAFQACKRDWSAGKGAAGMRTLEDSLVSSMRQMTSSPLHPSL